MIIWQDVIAGLLVGLAGLYVARRIWRAISARGGCGCGAASCASRAVQSRAPVIRELVSLRVLDESKGGMIE